jgi:hypothetical protein
MRTPPLPIAVLLSIFEGAVAWELERRTFVCDERDRETASAFLAARFTSG